MKDTVLRHNAPEMVITAFSLPLSIRESTHRLALVKVLMVVTTRRSRMIAF